MNISTIAIIPAKKESIRLPGKNTAELWGKPMYRHSIDYAISEGITPVVSTDDPEKIEWCASKGVLFVREVVDDTTLQNCIDQVLRKYPAKRFAVLQPSSPLRRPGLLRRMMDEGKPSAFTAERIKVIGMMDGEFQMAYREQDASRFLLHFDGNLIVCDSDFYTDGRCFFGSDSQIYLQKAPYTLQVDTDQDLSLFKSLPKDWLKKEEVS